jgi:hypothetical protein
MFFQPAGKTARGSVPGRAACPDMVRKMSRALRSGA